MSLEPNPRRNDYVGDGSTSVYDYDFPIIDASDLLVKILNTDFEESQLTLNVDYTVSGLEDQDGGSITLTNDLSNNFLLVILGRLPIEQQNNINNQGAFRPDIIEQEFDALAKVDQEQQEQIGQALKLPDTVSSLTFNSTLPSSIKNPNNIGKAIIINETGDGFDFGEAGGGSGTSGVETFVNISSDDDVDSGTRNYFCDTSGGDIDLTLPDPTTVPGEAFEVFNIDDGGANDVNVIGNVQGGAGDVLSAGESRTYKSNGLEFRISN